MAIRIEHQPSPGVVGMAAYAAGRGKARQRQRKDLLNFYRDEANRRERRAAQFRGFTYQGALEGMRQKALGERAEQKRVWDVADTWQKNLREEEVAKEAHKRAIEMQEDRQKDYADRAKTAADRAAEEEKRRHERDRDEEIRQEIMSGEMEFPDKVSQKKWEELQEAKTKAITDRNFDPILSVATGLLGLGGLLDEGRENILSQIEADEQRLLPLAKPRPSDDDFEQKTRMEGGKLLQREPSGKWSILDDDPGGERAKRDQRRERIKGIMAEKYPGSGPDSDRQYTVDEAILEDQKRERAIEFSEGSPPPSYVDPRTQDVPRPGPEDAGQGAPATQPAVPAPPPKPQMLGHDPEPQTEAEYKALPSGTLYIHPDGKTRRKP